MADRERLRVTVVEPWFAGSHRAWAEGYAAASAHDVTLVTHPGAHWKWRMQGSPLTLARALEERLERPPDVLLVSGMVHLPALLGLARRAIGDAAVVLYLHENQLTYPSDDGDLTYPLITWLSMAAADAVWCSSEFHRADLLGALPGFLARFPDPSHRPALDEVAGRVDVVPVGVDLTPFAGPRSRRGGRPLVLWNQRWEHDKAPERFVAAVAALAEEGVPFDVALAGQRFRTNPPALDDVRRRLADRIVHDGFAHGTHYAELLLRSDVVVSTARHEFFGIAVVEAAAAGAFPVVPDALSYRELFPPACRYGDGDGALVDRLRQVLADPPPTDELRRAVQRFDWRVMAPRYDEGLRTVARRVRSTDRRAPGASR